MENGLTNRPKWSYQFKRLFANRFGMTAAAFCLILLAGGLVSLFGSLGVRSACGGYSRLPAYAKGDPTAPSRRLEAPSTTLEGEAPVISVDAQLAEKTAKAEATVNKALEENRLLVQLYGGFQALTGRTVVEDTADPRYSVVKLPDDSLTFVNDEENVPEHQAAELKRLQLTLEDEDISLLYVQAPTKLEPGKTELPAGVNDTANASADALLEALAEKKIDTLDLRKTFAQTGENWRDYFYTTDHHWNQRGAFLAFQTVAGALENYSETKPVSKGTKRQRISIDDKYLDRENYDITTLEDYFLGSQGKRVGSLYAGAEDFELWKPKFPTLLTYSARKEGYGNAEKSVLFPERVEKLDWFKENPYTYYSGGDYAAARIKNYYNPQGPKVLVIRESFACAVTPYLAYACSEVTTVDYRYFTGDLLSYIRWVKPDVVVVLYSAGTTRTEEPFRLLTQPTAPGKGEVLRWKTDWVEEP